VCKEEEVEEEEEEEEEADNKMKKVERKSFPRQPKGITMSSPSCQPDQRILLGELTSLHPKY
jgi:hypothetical protein